VQNPFFWEMLSGPFNRRLLGAINSAYFPLFPVCVEFLEAGRFLLRGLGFEGRLRQGEPKKWGEETRTAADRKRKCGALVDQKTNEIPVARELINRLQLEDRFVSLDAFRHPE
jgi:hypothetical protein